MKRRGFFKALAGVLALPLLPETKPQWNTNFFRGSGPVGILHAPNAVLGDYATKAYIDLNLSNWVIKGHYE